MLLFVMTFGIMLLAFIGMAIGFVFAKKELKGSCGGIGNIPGMKSECSCSRPCEKRQAAMREQQEIRIVDKLVSSKSS